MTLEMHSLLLVAIILVAVIVGALVGAAVASSRAKRSEGEQTGSPETASADSPAPVVTDPEPTSKRRAALVLNPSKEGAEEFVSTAEAICREEGWDAPLVLHTTPDDPGAAMAEEALDAGVEVVIAAGGDGTVRAVAEVIRNTDTRLGIIPMGTGNLLARNLNLVLERPEWAMRIAMSGREDVVDVGTLALKEGGDKQAFLVMAGMGFDAEVMSDTNSDLKSKVGWLAYVEAGTRKLLGKSVDVTIEVDGGEPKRGSIRSVLAGNCGKVQGGVRLLPDALIDDGILDLLVISPKNLAQWVGVVASIVGRQGSKGLHTDVHQGEHFVIRSEEEVEIQVDGDAVGTTDYLELGIEPAALIVRTPTPEQRRKIRSEGWALGV